MYIQTWGFQINKYDLNFLKNAINIAKLKNMVYRFLVTSLNILVTFLDTYVSSLDILITSSDITSKIQYLKKKKKTI